MISHKAVSGRVLVLVIGAVALALAGGPSAAWADACTDAPPAGFGGVLSGAPGAGECTVSAVAVVDPTNAFNIDRTLRITGTGGIDASNDLAGSPGLVINVCVAPAPAFATCDVIIETGGFIDASDDAVAASPGGANEANDDAKAITLNVSRDVVLQGGSSITAENRTSGGDGGAITVIAGRDVSLLNVAGNAPGATISSAKTSTGGNGTGGAILITAGPPPQSPVGDVFISEFSVVKSSNNTQKAGRIDIIGGNSITVDGSVLAEAGTDNQSEGGPIFLITCTLLVGDTGKVSSTGNDPGPDLVHLEGCVVTIKGLVQSTGEAHTSGGDLCKAAPRGPAHVQANRPGFTNWTACVEVWSGTTIEIDAVGGNGEINANTATAGGASGGGWIDLFARGNISIIGPASAPFAVHANQDVGSGRHGGLITVASFTGSVTATGLALQADGNDNGGEIRIEAFAVVGLTGSTISATGDFNPAGGFGHGGIIFAKAFNSALHWTAGTGDVRPTGVDVTADDGTITLSGCGAVNLGASFPTNGGPDPNFPTVIIACGGAPAIPAYLTDGQERDLPPADCLARCGTTPGGGNGECNKSSIRSILHPVSGRFPGNLGPDHVVKVHLNQLIQPVVDNPTDVAPHADGYYIILVVANDTGALGGHTSQHVVIDKQYDKPFGLLACSVTLHAVNPGQPTGHIEQSDGAPLPPGASDGNIFVMDLHAADSAVAGWLVEGNNRELRNVNALGNGVGVKLDGDGNLVHNGLAQDNTGAGYEVVGDGNEITGAKAYDNGSHGISIAGSGNTVEKVDVGDKNKGNAGDGIHVEGGANTVSEADVFANAGHGIFVRGDGNQLKKNNAGDKGKGNIADGIHVGGNGNVLTENDAFANTGNGFAIFGNGNVVRNNNRAGDSGKGNVGDGFHVEGSQNVFDTNRASGNIGNGFNFHRAAGTANVLKNNRSNDGSSGGQKENAGCEYRFAESTTVDGGGNREDNVAFNGVAGKYPAQCKE